MPTYFCQHGLTTGADDGSSWEDAFRSAYDAIQGKASGDIVKIKEHAGIDCSSFAATVDSAFDTSSGGIDIQCGYDSSLTGTNGTPVTDQTGFTTFVPGTNTRRFLLSSQSFTASFMVVDGWNHSQYGSLGVQDDLYLTDCEFVDCTATLGGGAIAIVSNLDTHVLTRVIVHGCSASAGHGGGIYIRTSVSGSSEDTTLSDCEIYDCTSDLDGGGIYVYRNADVEFTGCSIYDNVAGDAGGGIMGTSGAADLSLEQCHVYGNESMLNGGGVYWDQSGTMSISDCEIYNNESTEGLGGGLYFDNAISVFTGNHVYGNTSYSDGGGVYAPGVNPVSCKIESNTSLNGNGGGIYSEGASATHINTVMTGNVSDGIGAALYHDSTGMSLVNCTIADNESLSTNYGGVRTLASAAVYNSILKGNVGSTLNVQLSVVASAWSLEYCDVQDKDGDGIEGSGRTEVACENGVAEFLGTGDDPYQLNPVTACVDGGSDGVPGYPSEDILGQTWRTIDMGAYAYYPPVVIGCLFLGGGF